MSEWQQLARRASTALKPLAAVAVTGGHEAWLVPLAIGIRLALASVVALVMVSGVEKNQRVETIKSVPAVINALLGRQPR